MKGSARASETFFALLICPRGAGAEFILSFVSGTVGRMDEF